MGEKECHVYLDRESNTSYVGDPSVGVPVSRDIIEFVAAQYHMEGIHSSNLCKNHDDIYDLQTSHPFN